ncbi:unnamed protein product [Rotaria magnacalcarata]|uniref:Chromo domain-containing protein n=1 Tax=Rotaria magnacalcarata TaxID=392030 RepID=A0A818W1C8_9BILA|nr:unnamed protein product [Rotaria magnacalcarata]CAF3718470.1 unnamed protein product [Rotaria magnacalcarata]
MPSSKNQDYVVEKVIGKRLQKGRTLYLIQWKGYSAEDNTWEPEENVKNCRDLVKAFESEQEKKDKSKIATESEKEGQINIRSTRSSQSPRTKSSNNNQRSTRSSIRSLPARKRSTSNDDIIIDDESININGHNEKKSRPSKRSRRSTTDSEATCSDDSHDSDILDFFTLDHIVDVRRNKKENKVEYSIQLKRNKKPTWINSNRLTEDYSQKVIDFLEEKYI